MTPVRLGSRCSGPDRAGRRFREALNITIATGPGGAIAAGVVNLATKKVTGLFWSGNSGETWKQLPTPALNNGSQAPVNFAIAIDPKNTNLVYVSGDRIAASPFT